MTLQQSITSALSHICYCCIFITISKPGDSCFTGSVSGFSWGQDSCSEGYIGTLDTLHMEACCRKIRNPRKNPSSLLVHPIFHLLKYNSSVFASTEEELNQGWSIGLFVPAAEKPSGFGLPLYSCGLSLWLRSTSHGTDMFSSGSSASLAPEEGS